MNTKSNFSFTSQPCTKTWLDMTETMRRQYRAIEALNFRSDFGIEKER